VRRAARRRQHTGQGRRGQRVVVHGFVYSLADGLLRDLGASVSGPGRIAETLREATRSLR
jgi:carbonic anhydrase